MYHTSHIIYCMSYITYYMLHITRYLENTLDLRYICTVKKSK